MNQNNDEDTEDEVFIPEYRINNSFVLLYATILSLNGICFAWLIGGHNQTASVFAAKLNWTGA